MHRHIPSMEQDVAMGWIIMFNINNVYFAEKLPRHYWNIFYQFVFADTNTFSFKIHNIESKKIQKISDSFSTSRQQQEVGESRR